MNFARLKGNIKQAGFYIPFTIYFLVFAVASVLAWRWLHINPLQADTAFGNIFLLLLKVAMWFAIIMLTVALLSVVVSLVHFVYQKKKYGIQFKIDTDLKESELHQKQTVRLHISPVLKPFFGFIKLRLQYDQNHFSKKFSLLETNRKKFFSNEIDGIYNWPLPQIKEYKVDRAVIYFEDVFQFFSVAIDLPAKSNFFTHPTAKALAELKVAPRKTEETSTRIDELRKVEGEYLNYKNFENNDDVRRIVWKIYAKNKELVVRIPEIMDPYASHIYMYTSYYSIFNTTGNSVAEVPFLNYYKVMAWTVYQNLVKKGFDVKYIPDQDTAKNNSADEQQVVKYQVSTSQWHTDKQLKNYVKAKDASVVLVSSFSDPEEVRQLAEQHGKDIRFIFVKLTDGLRRQNLFDWVQWLFVHNEKNDIDVYKRAWAISPLRQKVIQNEKNLAAIIGQFTDPVVV
ncbi:DUF58 domain-containing protein [Aridibaculum aurantiacum]|uniref:DUF58 domain-containing protein n=1 Tax=Aridibaculum aurantiacum TaxID=2810307 RepID=UPI001A976D84|nr:DUF58 domain-containing protein [Aridibaculum aurantiacum]